jgi:hypothetical protein
MAFQTFYLDNRFIMRRAIGFAVIVVQSPFQQKGQNNRQRHSDYFDLLFGGGEYRFH